MVRKSTTKATHAIRLFRPATLNLALLSGSKPTARLFEQRSSDEQEHHRRNDTYESAN
jgi:hypothetical protein